VDREQDAARDRGRKQPIQRKDKPNEKELAPSFCPHPQFEQRHLNYHEVRGWQDALFFSRRARPGQRNSVCYTDEHDQWANNFGFACRYCCSRTLKPCYLITVHPNGKDWSSLQASLGLLCHTGREQSHMLLLADVKYQG
jgi:hypothetical protein